MDNVLTVNEQGLLEVSPTASRDNQLAFIDNYRQIQDENTAQIGAQTHALGSDLPAQLGGLHGPSAYWRSRYQTPQTESRVAGLRSAAQLQALNQLMSNDLAKWKDKYNQAYNASNGGNGGNGGSDGGTDVSSLNITTETSSPDTIEVSTNPNISGNNIIQSGEGTYQNTETGETYRNAPTSFMGLYSQGMNLGVWPDGSPFTVGSTYTQGGKTYKYDKLGNMPTPSVFLVGD